MRTRAAAWLAWSVWTLCVALVLLTGLLSHLTPALTLPLRERVPLQAIAGSWVEDYFWLVPTLGVVPAVLALTYPTVGALIASRRSHNPIGWLFCLAGLVVIFLSFATAYANYSVFAHFGPDLPATKYMAWLADRAFLGTVDTSTFTINGVHEWREYSSGIALPAMLVVLTWLVLLFPTGRLTSRIWLVAGLGALIGSVLITLWWTTEPGPMYFYPSIDNPFGIEGHTRDGVEGWGKLGWWVGLSSLVVSGFSCADRWIEAQGEERQQMKWFVYSLLLLVIAFVLSLPVLFLPALTLLPIAVGVAILRYHLYEIDLIINRTLVYGSLTAILVALYFGLIVVSQRVFVLDSIRKPPD